MRKRPDHMESYWGDLAGEPLLQPRSYGDADKRSLRAWFVVLIFGFLIAVFVAAMFLFSTQPSLAEPITVPHPCVEVAKQYGMIAPAKMERSEILQHLNSVEVIAIGILVPAVRRCRAALKLELKK